LSRKIFEISKKFFSTGFYTIETKKIKTGFLEREKIRFSRVRKTAFGTVHEADRIADGETLQGERKRGENASSAERLRTGSAPDAVGFLNWWRWWTASDAERWRGSEERQRLHQCGRDQARRRLMICGCGLPVSLRSGKAGPELLRTS
jgi:hypothetical protein